MTTEQLMSTVLKHNGEIAGMQEKLSSAHKRIDENDRIIEGVHKLASNVEALALQVKHLTDRIENSVTRLEAGLKAQGERIGVLEKEPADKWRKLVAQIISLAVAAVVGGVIAAIIH